MKLQGYRTIVVNVLALIFTILGMQGLEIGIEEQGAISTGILAIVNIILRVYTKTPVFESEESSKQKGFAKTSLLCITALIVSALFMFTSGCSLIQEKTWQPFSDCANVTSFDNNSLGACFVSVKILAINIDAAADSQIITKEQETAFLDKLESALELLSATKTVTANESANASESLKLAQIILAELAKQVPRPE